MPSKRAHSEKDERPDLVVIRIPEESLVIHGELCSAEDEVVIEGIAEGLSYLNQRPLKLKELNGFSSQRGQIWLERLLVPNTTVSGDERRPSTIKLKAFTLYSGDFDPRATSIVCAQIALTDLPPLAFKTKEALNEPGPQLFESGREILHGTEHYTLELVGSFEDDFNLTAQFVFVRFHEPQSHTLALQLLDQAICLIQLLTASTLRTNDVLYRTDKKSAFHWRSGGQKQRIGSSANWLERPGKIVTLLQSLMPKWIEQTAGPYGLHRVQVILGAPARETMEGLFLTYCQSFEDLNGLRVPQSRLMPDDEYQAQVVDKLEPVVNALPGNDLRRRIRRSLADANRLGLEDRLRAVFSKPPDWLWRVQECFPQVFNAIAKRRNDLSHGEPRGSVHNNADANTINLQSSLMFLFCLAELLYLANDDETRIEKIVDASEESAHVVWLAGQMKSGKLDA